MRTRLFSGRPRGIAPEAGNHRWATRSHVSTEAKPEAVPGTLAARAVLRLGMSRTLPAVSVETYIM